MSQQITWRELLTFVSPVGQQQMIDFIRQARETRGENWLEEIKATFPMFSWLADLVANHTADEALNIIAEQYPNWPIRAIAGEKLKALHGVLLTEINRPRG